MAIVNVIYVEINVCCVVNAIAQNTHKKNGKICIIHTTRIVKTATNFRRKLYGENLITRQQYKNIKKMNHVQMSTFYTRVWQDGFNDGIKAGKKNKAAAVKPGDIEKAIAGLKGIGEVKLKVIMQRVYKLYEEASK